LINVKNNIEILKDNYPLVKPDIHHLVLNLNLKVKNQLTYVRNDHVLKYNFKRADFLKLYTMYRDADYSALGAFNRVECATDYFYQIVDFVFKENVPLVKSHIRKKYPCWFTNEIIRTIKLKYFYRKRMKNSEYNKLMFCEIRKKLKSMIRKAYNNYIIEIEENIKYYTRSL